MTNIALVGKLHAGKTTIANALVESHGYTRIALADAVKDDAAELLNHWLNRNEVPEPSLITRAWIEANKAKVRPLLQWLGTEWGRETISRTWWINQFLLSMQFAKGPVVCDDCRFLDETEALRRAGFVIVRINRPDHERFESAGNQGIHGHVSEVEQEQIVADYTVINSAELWSIPRVAALIMRHITRSASGVESDLCSACVTGDGDAG